MTLPFGATFPLPSDALSDAVLEASASLANCDPVGFTSAEQTIFGEYSIGSGETTQIVSLSPEEAEGYADAKNDCFSAMDAEGCWTVEPACRRVERILRRSIYRSDVTAAKVWYGTPGWQCVIGKKYCGGNVIDTPCDEAEAACNSSGPLPVPDNPDPVDPAEPLPPPLSPDGPPRERSGPPKRVTPVTPVLVKKAGVAGPPPVSAPVVVGIVFVGVLALSLAFSAGDEGGR